MKIKLFICILLAVTCCDMSAQKRKVVSRSVTKNNNGSSLERIKYDDGAELDILTSKCNICFGLNTCRICHGRGGRLINYSYPQWHPCSLCKGTGKCNSCGGDGISVTYTERDPISGRITIINGADGSVTSGYYNPTGYGSYDSYTDKNEKNTNTNTNKKTSRICSGCNGTGKICEDVPLTLGDIYHCSFCGHNGYGKHVQVRCIQCGGKGSY